MGTQTHAHTHTRTTNSSQNTTDIVMKKVAFDKDLKFQIMLKYFRTDSYQTDPRREDQFISTDRDSKALLLLGFS